jgi:hypothetical protein
MGARMKNVYEVLRQKELEVLRVEKEVEALRVATPLLSEPGEAAAFDSTVTLESTATQSAGHNPIMPLGATRRGDCLSH